MKRLLLLCLVTLCTIMAHADPINLARAKQLAAGYMLTNEDPQLVNNGITANVARRKVRANTDANPPYYIFSRGKGKGFVVVAGDDILPEIIGYTEIGDFDPDNVPPAFSDYLFGMEVAIDKYHEFIEKNGKEAFERIKAKRAPRRPIPSTDLGPLVTSSWEQGWPYYDYCPWDTQTNARSLTGCVATSTSAVIHYWRNDNPRYLLTGTHAYTTWTKQLQVDPGYPKGHPMKWELMQDSYGSIGFGNANDHYTCVSELLAIVGDLVDMDYGSDGSGAQSNMQPNALNAFNLNGTNVWYSGVNNMDTWEEWIQNDLAAGRPILYSGYSVDANNVWAGHAFIVDGYRLSDGKYSFDFGWGPYWKGYWVLTDANGFNTDQSMTYLIYPRHLNLSAQISAPNFTANTNNTVTVKVQNNGTLDYKTAINLFCSTSPNQPTSWGGQQADWTTIPKGGGDVTLTFNVNPGNGDSWYLIVVDSDFHILDRIKVPATETIQDVTSSYITNPSFETNSTNGWTTGNGHVVHIGNRSNDGNFVWRAVGLDGTYVLDSWKAGDVGEGISQQLSGLPTGYYKLTAKVATDPGKHVTVFAGNQTVTTGANECGKYYMEKVTIDNIHVIDGRLKIGVQDGDWYKVDDFKLYKYTSQPESTASNQHPYEGQTYFDITNAMAPWLSTASFGNYSNNGFAIGTWGNYSGADGAVLNAPFFEKWTPSGNYLDNATLSQTLQELPNGTYYIGGSFIATSQGLSSNVEGVSFWAGNQSIKLSTGDGTPEIFALEVEVTDGTLPFGLKMDCATANWVAVDNLFLYWKGSESSYYAMASADSPVRVPLTNPRMENDMAGWTLDGYWQKQGATYNNFDPDFMECWVGHGTNLSDRSVKQTVYLHDGTYQLSAAVNAVQQGNTSLTVSGVDLKLGSASVSCHTGNGAPEIFKTPKKAFTDGNYELGLYISSTNANWVGWDNVVLYCYGADVEEESEYERALRLCKAAAASYESSVDGAAKAALAQYEWTDDQLATKSEAEIATAVRVLNNGTTIAGNGQMATSTITNADLNNTNLSDSAPNGWQLIGKDVSGGGDVWIRTQDGAQVYNLWYPTVNSIDMIQTVYNLPNGVYRLSMDMGTQGFDVAAKLFNYAIGSAIGASQQVTTLNTGNSRAFDNYSCAVEVMNNQITIGVRSLGHYFQIRNIQLEFVTDPIVAAKETDASYFRQDYFWGGRNELEYDASFDKYQDGENIVIYPEQPNQLIKAKNNNQFAVNTNKIVDGICQQLVITDGSPMAITSNGVGTFTATNASYIRNMPSYDDNGTTAYREWGTLILPYPLQSDDNIQYYVLSELVEGETSWMSFTEENGVIPPNTPVVFASKGNSNVTALGSGNVSLTTAEQGNSGTDINGWKLTGVYSQTSLSDSQIDGTIYYVAQDKFWRATASTGLTIAPFRAYFQGPQRADAKVYNLRVIDGNTTSVLDIENGRMLKGDVYNLSGQLVRKSAQGLDGLTPGIYIIAGKKVIIR